MKFILPFVVFFGIVPAFATQKQCKVSLKTPAGVQETTEVLTPRVIEGVDLASYIMDKDFGVFHVFVSEVDGNYFAGIRSGGNYVTSEGVDTITLTSSYRNRLVSIYCY